MTFTRTQYDVPTGAESCVTSLSIDDDYGQTFAAGFGDGSLRLYDKRRGAKALLEVFAPHKTWIKDVTLQQGVRSMITGRRASFSLPFD